MRTSGRDRSSSTATDATKPRAASNAKKPAEGGFFSKFMGGLAAPLLGTNKNPHGYTLLPASSCEMSGWLWKQGSKINAWQKRYFLLHGALITYYEDEEHGKEPDEGRCRGAFMVSAAERWPYDSSLKKPAQVPQHSSTAAQQHSSRHSRSSRGQPLTPSSSRTGAGQRVERALEDGLPLHHRGQGVLRVCGLGGGGGAMGEDLKSKLALKQKAQGGGLPSALGGLGAIAEDGAVAEMPEHEELDALVKEMLDSQGYKEAARNNIMLLSDDHKWQLLQSYQQKLTKDAGDIREQPEHWINVLNIEPSVENLQSLSVLIRQKPVIWVTEFIELGGVAALCELLEHFEKRTFKKPHDFELMDQVLRCLRSLMNLESGMNAMLGIDAKDLEPRPSEADDRTSKPEDRDSKMPPPSPGGTLYR